MKPHIGSEVNKLNKIDLTSNAQLVEHRTGIAEVTGSNPVEALGFFSGFFFPIALCTNDVTNFRPPLRLRQTKSNSVREVKEMYANGE